MIVRKPISQANDKNLPAALTALRRAAQMVRELAFQTGTAIIVQRNSKLVRITAGELRKENVQ